MNHFASSAFASRRLSTGFRYLVAAVVFGGNLVSVGLDAYAGPVGVTNLVTDDQSVNSAQITDPDLKNAWGISSSPVSPFWVSDNGSGKTTIYAVNPTTNVTSKVGLVTIPGSGPTGQVFNSSPASPPSFNGNLFLFVNEDGTVSGWRGALGTTAEVLQTASASNVYKGAAFATIGQSSYLYAANFASGHIDVLKGSSTAPTLSGTFIDPNLPTGFAPFNVENIGGSLYVAYAQQGPPGTVDEVDGPGLGYVSKFTLQGEFLGRIASAGPLNAPWGMALAPSSFGALAGDLLVGNFGDGNVNIIDLANNTVVGKLEGVDGNPVQIDGLWALKVGNGGNGGSLDKVYFTAGPGDEVHGLLGLLTPVPEPGVFVLLAAGLLALFGACYRLPKAASRQ